MDYFIQALKILIGPIIFLTIVLGVVSLESLKQVGSIGAKALLYFEVVSTFALAIGIFIANIMGPGKGMNLDPSTLDKDSVAQFVNKNIEISAQNEILHILKDAIPTDIIAAFSGGKTLQILVIALACAFIISLMRVDERKAIQKTLEIMQSFVFKILEIIMYFLLLLLFLRWHF